MSNVCSTWTLKKKNLHKIRPVTRERCFVGSSSNNQTDQEDERVGLEVEGFERENLKRLFLVKGKSKKHLNSQWHLQLHC
jgi:hypothetical protein